jgi:hypothetical protein
MALVTPPGCGVRSGPCRSPADRNGPGERHEPGVKRAGTSTGARTGPCLEPAQPPAMPDQGDAEILQVLGRQVRQDPCVDRVRAEGRLVFFEPEIPQPVGDIYRHRSIAVPRGTSVARMILIIECHDIGARRAVSDDCSVTCQQGEMLGPRLGNQHSGERIAMQSRQGD